MKIQNNSTFLFQGDSVTDAGRDRKDPVGLGNGYPMMFASWFSAYYPNLDVKFINKGISGNRVKDLEARWQKDCLKLKPAWVSILIGINDCWRRYDSNDPTSVEKFEAGYRNILTQIRENLDAKIILCEPFVLPVPADRKKWREDLDPKINAVRNLAREFQTYLVPLDGIFAQASIAKPSSFWAQDGVHPTLAGHALIAKSIFDLVESV
ncbi:MAG TPA: GDSL family lipase [Clostridiales bacterium]|nr:SGNH/GDSL hydrolase family protein [Clostridia bacterium]MDD4679402.1 SGNH/GDSL hydrolase family protein [Clostridia bacterium]HCS74269.1 GDSL family lipase [Clostridiales bacterium]